MASIRGILNSQSLNELTSENSQFWIISNRKAKPSLKGKANS